MRKISTISLLFATAFGASDIVSATHYTYELSADQTWTDGGSTNTTTNYVRVRAYVPGSNSVTYRTVPIYVPTYSSESNSLGDIVGSVFTIYGSGTTAFIDPYDGAKKTIIYPAAQILHTKLLAINDDRLAVGNYNVLGGHAAGKGFIYDVIYDQYTQLVAPDTVWTDLGDINNLGQIVGTSINDGGASRKGFVYDCQSGFQLIDVPGSSWTVPKKIDDEGNIYGIVSGITDATYFIARPGSLYYPPCSLVPRDDIAEGIVFSGTSNLELSGDRALGVKIADFDGRGLNDLLVYHEIGKTILYLGEEGFEEKIKYSGDEFNTLAVGVNIETEWDLNNDGLIDKIDSDGTNNFLYFAKVDGGYYYVPQQLPPGNLKFGDLNGDGLVDFAEFSGGFVSITHQAEKSGVDPEPVIVTDPAVPPPPFIVVPLRRIRIAQGIHASGDVKSIEASDDQYVEVIAALNNKATRYITRTDVHAISPNINDIAALRVAIELASNTTRVNAYIRIYNFTRRAWETLGRTRLALTDSETANFELANPSAYVREPDGRMKLQIRTAANVASATQAHTVRIDNVRIEVAPLP